MKKVVKDAEKLAKDVAAKADQIAEKVSAEVKEAPKAVKKAAGRKTASARKAVKETVYLQYLGKEINKDDLMKEIKEIWTKQMKKKVSDMKSVTIYLKPEENMAYYVINDDVTGNIELR